MIDKPLSIDQKNTTNKPPSDASRLRIHDVYIMDHIETDMLRKENYA